MARITPESLTYIVHHVVLPPQLPSEPEPASIVQKAEQDLLRLAISSAQEFTQHASESAMTWGIVKRMLERWLLLNTGDTFAVETFLAALPQMSSYEALPLVIKAQNAGLIIRKTESGALFECFELSPPTSAVFACKGALRRKFPAHAISIPDDVFNNRRFRIELAKHLRKLDAEKVKEMMPVSRKAEAETGEIRDTVHPRLVTEMLMATLGSLGAPIRVPQIEKRTREESLWHNALLPWRRSPQWLAVSNN